MTREEINHIQWECQQFLYRITMLIDSGQWKELAACYTEDGILFRPSDAHNGIQGRTAILESFLSRPPRTTCHLLGNSVFDVQSENSVVARSRVWLITGGIKTGSNPINADSQILIGSFTDYLECHDGNWYLAKREGGIELKYNYT